MCRFQVSLSNRPLKTLTPFIGLTLSLCLVVHDHRISKSPHLFTWYMSSDIDLRISAVSGSPSWVAPRGWDIYPASPGGEERKPKEPNALKGRAARVRRSLSKTDLINSSTSSSPMTRLQLLALRHRRYTAPSAWQNWRR